MPNNYENALNRKLQNGEKTIGFWVTLESPSITEIAVAMGVDWVVIDAEHGHLDFKDVVEHLRAAWNSNTTALVRIQEIEQGLIKRVLDIGAEGIIVPQITCAAEVEAAVRFSKYPPQGVRGVGGERATRWGSDLAGYTSVANDETLVIPMMETIDAESDIEAILQVDGVDGFFFGPADFSATAGYVGQWEGPGIAERILTLKDRIVSAGKACGVMGTDLDNAKMRCDQGFQMVGLASDVGMLISGIRKAQEVLP